VALYAASLSMLVIAILLVYVAIRIKIQLDRLVAAIEQVESELAPLARETRAALRRVEDIALRGQQAIDALEAWLLSPFRAVDRATRIVRTGASAFVRALKDGRTPSERVF
jgi:acyl-ACP thioesterase